MQKEQLTVTLNIHIEVSTQKVVKVKSHILPLGVHGRDNATAVLSLS